ncbi:cysteine proteinase [Zopfia rhizophila CBS 207.26]|uniref:Ubiquitin carboxyl-terminal hydrolase n=1 Tax=Zopfia rhizophila CBS 207.26 TaxID=1314779 RepID=A0A6A6DEH7_9PEZI|nr:cysteine proteinase [Zopfia rhizophila CBS 207.26]
MAKATPSKGNPTAADPPAAGQPIGSVSSPKSRKRSNSPDRAAKKKKVEDPSDLPGEIRTEANEIPSASGSGVLATSEGDGTAPETPRKGGSQPGPRYSSPLEAAATDLDKRTWGGFCEIESDPVFFSVMVREMGVKGVSVREVVALDPELLTFLPKPIYGLILLFRYRVVGEQSQKPNCPNNVWFANQMPVQNSCATLAMINILLNTKDVDIGENLRQFKDFTQDFTPFQRGEQLANFEFVKRIHNSFAKKMDMLEADKHLSIKAKKNIKSRRDSDSSNQSEDIEDNAFHFIAFVPIDDEVWKLDGMDVNPTRIAKYEGSDDWLSMAADQIEAIMSAAGDISYNLVAMVQSPVVALRNDMCSTIATLNHLETRLDTLNKEWREFVVTKEDGTVQTPFVSPNILAILGVHLDELKNATVPEDVKVEIDAEEDMMSLLDRRTQLLSEQTSLHGQIQTEMMNEEDENDKAKERRWDYGPVFQLWLRKLAENGYLDQNLDRFMSKS